MQTKLFGQNERCSFQVNRVPDGFLARIWRKRLYMMLSVILCVLFSFYIYAEETDLKMPCVDKVELDL
jgi:hypothetical protein